jgi:streptomycin 6-kinase
MSPSIYCCLSKGDEKLLLPEGIFGVYMDGPLLSGKSYFFRKWIDVDPAAMVGSTNMDLSLFLNLESAHCYQPILTVRMRNKHLTHKFETNRKQ